MSSLESYNSKRKFENTPEPPGQKTSYNESNRFVIQQHHARRLHYDFRIQSEDVLISWAIPKVPLNDPKVKRLAVKVEDHPLDYIHFEGNIPEGNYGAGTVMVWDMGYYFLDESRTLPNPHELQNSLHKGSLTLYLVGEKLKGKFNLVKIKKSEKDEWLFMKAYEEEALDKNEERSVISGRTIREIKSAGNMWISRKEDNAQIPKPEIESSKRDFPGFIHPMLATPLAEPFSKADWIFELKLDGYRALTTNFKQETKLYSRNGNLFNDKYPSIVSELNSIKADFITDGEICYINSSGNSDFQELQNDMHEKGNIHYYLFDILWLNGHDLTSIPLLQRKELLKVLIKGTFKHLHFLTFIEKDGKQFFDAVQSKQQEGIIAKKSDSLYYPSFRSKEWLKIKTSMRQEMIICGIILSDASNRKFKSLICGLYEGGKLIYTGKVGSGFTEKLQASIYNQVESNFIDSSPLVNPPNDKKIQWLKPELICEVKFTEWTKEGVMRHPSFIGLRKDKKPSEVNFEKPISVNQLQSKVTLTNPDKILWPVDNITKNELFEYYKNLAPYILPYLKGRPQSLYRTPDGITKHGFFQKNVKNIAPDWAETINIKNDEGKITEYLVCNNLDSLLFMVNLGCIEINPWSSSISSLDKPDYMVFDLDPVDVDFDSLIEVAHHFKNVLSNLKIPSYLKTSGSRGLHIYVPIIPTYSFPQIQRFVKIIADYVHQKTKSLTSFERSPSKRKGKIYLDFLQNGKGKTMASVYSLRPRPGATVSAPITWDELKPGFSMHTYNIHTMSKRLKQKGDVWKDFFLNKVDLGKMI